MLTYRSPKIFVQFIDEMNTYVAPTHIISARTMKSMGGNPGVFELSFKTSALAEGTSTVPLGAQPSGAPTDYWLNRIRPMTVAVISMGDDQTLKQVEQAVAQAVATVPAGTAPEAWYNRIPQAQKQLLEESIVMVGLVEEVAFSLVVTGEGPERVLRVSGRDFSRVLMDDSLRRIARASGAPRDERRLITLGDERDMPAGPRRSVSSTDRQRLLDRASLTTKDAFWQDISQQGTDSKMLMRKAVANILDKAPSMNVRLANGTPLQTYFNTTPVISPELSTMTVRATLTLFSYNGPVWNAINQLAPGPLAETYVDTVGLRNVLHIRRPPFYRPQLMGSLVDRGDKPGKMREFMRQAGRPPEETNRVLQVVQRDLQDDQFARGAKLVTMAEVIGLALSRSSLNVLSQYQVIPALLMGGDMGDMVAFQGVSASYLYDMPTAVRFGSKILQAVCPWDITGSRVGREEQKERDKKTAEELNRITDAQARREEAVLRQAQAVSQEQTLAAAETIRLYYYMRDAAAFLNGSVTLRARPDIRIGDRIHLRDHDDMIAYVESVQHSYQFGQPFVTRLNVTRGQPFNPAPGTRLVTYDVEAPTLNMNLGESKAEPAETQPRDFFGMTPALP